MPRTRCSASPPRRGASRRARSSVRRLPRHAGRAPPRCASRQPLDQQSTAAPSGSARRTAAQPRSFVYFVDRPAVGSVAPRAGGGAPLALRAGGIDTRLAAASRARASKTTPSRSSGSPTARARRSSCKARACARLTATATTPPVRRSSSSAKWIACSDGAFAHAFAYHAPPAFAPAAAKPAVCDARRHGRYDRRRRLLSAARVKVASGATAGEAALFAAASDDARCRFGRGADPENSFSLEGTAARGARVVAARVLSDDGSVRRSAAREHAHSRAHGALARRAHDARARAR